MKKPDNRKLKISAIAGFLLFLIPLFYQIAWIYIFGLYDNHADRVDKFKTILPPLLDDPRNATWVFIASSLGAIVLSAIWLKQRSIPFRILSITTLVLACLLTLLLLFSMM